MDLETHAHNMRLLFDSGYGNAACTLAEQFGSGGIAERLLAALENQNEVASLRAQLAAVTAQRDELLAAGEQIADALRDLAADANGVYLDAWESAIARAQPEQPQQPPTQQPMVAEPPIQSGECSFLDHLPKGPALGRFSASERAELDELKRKAFKAGEP